MSDLQAFLDLIKLNESLQDKLTSAQDLDALLFIAKEAGFAVSKETWTSERAIYDLSEWINEKMSQLNAYVAEFREKRYAAGDR